MLMWTLLLKRLGIWVGGALYNSDGILMSFFSEPRESSFLEKVKRGKQKNVIQEMEMLALLVRLSIWCPTWNGFRVAAFTDSEAVRHSFLKTWSKNDPCSYVLKFIFELECLQLHVHELLCDRRNHFLSFK